MIPRADVGVCFLRKTDNLIRGIAGIHDWKVDRDLGSDQTGGSS